MKSHRQEVSDRQFIESFWKNPPFWGSQLENNIARCWYWILLGTGLFFFCWGAWFNKHYALPNTLKNVTVLFKDPFIASLGIALILSTIAFKSWQAQFKSTFANCLQSGIVEDSPGSVEKFRRASEQFARLTNSRRRFILAGIIIGLTFTANRTVIIHSFMPEFGAFRFFLLSAVCCFVFFAYAIGVVGWCLISTSFWIASISDEILQIQAGHSDGCCGLEEVGNCCLQSTIPLLIGMVLCLIWSDSRHLLFFKTYVPEWLNIIIPVAYGFVAVLFGLACALVFLPLRGLHSRLDRYRSQRELIYTQALGICISEIDAAVAQHDDALTKTAADRLKLVQSLEPDALKLASWPFDKASLIKYAITPAVSLGASYGKELFQLFIR